MFSYKLKLEEREESGYETIYYVIKLSKKNYKELGRNKPLLIQRLKVGTP